MIVAPFKVVLDANVLFPQAEFNIDAGRLYITGISMGCYGTWDIIMRNPEMFAAASPQSCRGDPDRALLAGLKDVPFWSKCGTNDRYFAGAQAMADGMQEIGATARSIRASSIGCSLSASDHDHHGLGLGLGLGDDRQQRFS